MLTVLLILSFLVFIHELGHYLVAKWRDVKVEEFGLGYPPRVKKLFTFQGTDFTINWIPFGGFVKLLGEDQQPDAEAGVKTSVKKNARFDKATSSSKLLILLAGAVFNFIFGVIVFGLVFSKLGIPQPVDEARIGEIAPGSPAAEAGIPTQVEVKELIDSDGQIVSIAEFPDLVKEVDKRRGQEVTLVTTGECRGLSCDETLHQYVTKIRTVEETPEGQGALGVVWGPAFIHYSALEMPFRSAWYGLQQAVYLGAQILYALRDLMINLVANGQVPGEIAGPVGIVDQVSASGLLNQGFHSILFFAGMLSINLAIMNVLPIPPLDGGRAFFVVLASVFRGKFVPKLEYYANYTGYILLLVLIVLVTIRDVMRMIG